MDCNGPQAQIGRTGERAAVFVGSLIIIVFMVTAVAVRANAAVSEQRLADVDVKLGNGGVDVGVSAPDLGTEVDVGVGVGDGELDAGVNAETPAGNVNVGVGNGSDSGESPSQGSSDSTQGSTSNDGSDSGGGSSSDSPKSSTASDGAASDDGRDRGSSSEKSASGDDSVGSASGTGTDGDAANVNDASEVDRTGDARADGGNTSVISQFIASIPDWVWLVFAVLGLTLLALGVFAVRERRRRQAADRVALLDPLTGIANVKAFDERMAAEWSRAQRYRGELGLLVIDLDKFKHVNDENGHAAGDRVLVETAQQLTERTRSTDFCARVGGDEFAVICPETEIDGLRRLRGELEATLPETIGNGVGASIGAAVLRSTDEKPDDLVKRADAAMYQRKSLRREVKDGRHSKIAA